MLDLIIEAHNNLMSAYDSGPIEQDAQEFEESFMYDPESFKEETA